MSKEEIIKALMQHYGIPYEYAQAMYDTHYRDGSIDELVALISCL